jgi:ketosteroid isomerase-like protein
MTPAASSRTRAVGPAVRWIGLGLLLLAAGAAVYLLLPSEERKIRKQMAGLAEALSVPAGEGDIPRLARAQRVRRELAEDVTIRFEQEHWPPIEGRDTVAGLVARPWPQTSDGLRIELHDVVVELNGDLADVRFRVRVLVDSASSEPATLDGRLVALTLRRGESGWLVASARIMDSDDAER